MADNNNIRNPKGRFGQVSGTLFAMAIAIVFPIVAGCTSECNECPDPAGTNAPPFPPVGVFSITGDGQVEICWLDNQENNFVEGYAVYRDDNKDGLYDWIADVDWADLCYTDTDVNNGDTYYYAVLAFDWENRESELSFEDVDDTPRPEGFDVVLRDYLGQSPTTSGWGFESRSVQAWDDITTDIYFGTLTDQQTASDVSFIFTAAEVDIQDYGFIETAEQFRVFVDWAPTQGWASLERVEAVDRHAYIVRTRSGGTNYAKIWLKSVTNSQVTLDWAYQEAEDNPELSPGAKGGASR
jgi:hypothetical protein